MRDFRLRISNISGALSGIQIDVNVNIIFENMNYIQNLSDGKATNLTTYTFFFNKVG